MLKFALTGLCAALLAAPALADREALADDGRQIILKDDGSWAFKNNDRLATSSDGTRVRLKDDGNWEFIGNAPSETEQQVRTETLDIELDQIITEFTKEKAGSKNNRYNSQTVFYFDVDVSSYGAAVTPALDNLQLITVKDNKNTEYPVIQVNPASASWQPGSEQTLAIRIDGSPSGSIIWGSTKITLTIDKSVFSTQSDLTFTERTDEIKKKKVSELVAL